MYNETFSAPCTVLNNGILLEYDNVITGFNLGYRGTPFLGPVMLCGNLYV